ncbi:hypothetical protein CKM354_000813600 [Cercospora kikuchii]|uniref:Uncharacterized protein n=1 Tax=Cercospora kikuchii TaxID=84275 RepID=A0A9P3CKM8_9PEZI|nr:uncharacterized protein CKM354_000813600 [Cercospora kikuchii]GIZ44952.1 hypothetical protein CKM354_000813600 [Cercospora kikuchii]
MDKVRSFSTKAANAYKQWAINGTTQNANPAANVMHKAVSEKQPLLGLKNKAQYGIINGNPHSTPKRDGSEDPPHSSSVIVVSEKEKYSFHFYTEAGKRKIKFNDKRIPDIDVSDEFYEQAMKEGNEETRWWFDKKEEKFVKFDTQQEKWVEGFEGKKEEGPWKGLQAPWNEK